MCDPASTIIELGNESTVCQFYFENRFGNFPLGFQISMVGLKK